MKPAGAFGGVASIYVYSSDSGTWTESQRLYPLTSNESGEPLYPSINIVNGTLVAAASDALLQWGAHVFTSEEGIWTPTTRVPVDTEVQTDPGASMSLNDFMKFIRPAPRTIAYNGSLVAVAVMAGQAPLTGVHLFKQEDNQWNRLQTLSFDEGDVRSQLGSSLAWGEGFLVIGNPEAGASGKAHIFEENEEGEWVQTASLQSEDLKEGAGLSTSIAVQGNTVLLGAPGPAGTLGSVLTFERNEDNGAWKERLRVQGRNSDTDNQFGKAVAFIGDEWWIGAPRASGGKGRVYRVKMDSVMFSMHQVEIDIPGEDWAFGSSIAGSEDYVVIGAPGAYAGDGRAVLFSRNSDGEWETAAFLRPDEPLQPITGTENSCEEGMALNYECSDVDLLSFLPIADFGGEPGERVSDVWGWTDPIDNREFALIGRTGGAAIIDVTNPILPVYMGLVTANPTNVRDLKVYKNHLFFTGDGAGDHGLVVFDLTRLRSMEETPVVFEPDVVYRGIASAHNLIIDEESGFAYPVGASRGGETCGGGLHMVDIREPLNPTFAGCYEDTIGLFSDGRTHDGQCVVYKGPDSRYSGKQICLASNETGLRIVDVTDKGNPTPISVARYPRVAYVHQGWLTDDHRYFYLNDELDELVGMTPNTRTMVWDIAELDDPILIGEFQGSTTATDHNLYIKGNRMYQANYESGLRVWDVSNPEQPTEIGYFDTTPNDKANPPGFFGAWTAYPYFESGTVIVSSVGEGLFIVKPKDQEMP